MHCNSRFTHRRGPLLRNLHIGQLWFGRHCVWIESQSWPDLMQSKISNQELKRHYIRFSWDFYVCTYFRSTALQFSCFLSPTIPKPCASSFQCRILSVTEVLRLPDPCVSSFHRSTALDYDTRSLFECLHLWLHSMHHQTSSHPQILLPLGDDQLSQLFFSTWVGFISPRNLFLGLQGPTLHTWLGQTTGLTFGVKGQWIGGGHPWSYMWSEEYSSRIFNITG